MVNKKGRASARRMLCSAEVYTGSGGRIAYQVHIVVTSKVTQGDGYVDVPTSNAETGEALQSGSECDARKRGRFVAQGLADSVAENAARLGFGFAEAQALQVEASEAVAGLLEEANNAVPKTS